MPNLRLTNDEPEIDPPAPLPFRSWREAGDTIDAVAGVEDAFRRVQFLLDDLSEQADELPTIPFPRRMTNSDEGPWAA